MEKATLIEVEGMTCQSCVKTIKTNIMKEKSINSLEISHRQVYTG
jgi:copper chaperone CopZ